MDKENTEVIKNKTFGEERALYGLENIDVQECIFDGPEDGESALKECSKINVNSCFFNLRYPLWHARYFSLNKCKMTDKARAALWYDSFGTISESELLGIKALRECTDIRIRDSVIDSPEFGWKCNKVILDNNNIKAEYLFLDSKVINVNHLTLDGKYSFQYTENVKITNSHLKTKDAFWHGKNITVKDSVIEGEYLAWFSDGLTLENCTIIGTQPFCYCTNLKLINCRMEKCDLAFEYSDVEAEIYGEIDSVKNPRNGHITADMIKEIIITEDSKCSSNCSISSRLK